MELSSAIFRDILSPIAAFVDDIPPAKENNVTSGREENANGASAPSPQIVPILQNHHQAPIRSELGPTHRYKWTVQGADSDARRFFVVPQFALDKPPLRIDVYLPELEEYDVQVKRVLRPEEVVYTRRDSIAELGISRLLEGFLEKWSLGYDDGDEGRFEREYGSLPFGSRVLVTVGGMDVGGGGGGIDIGTEVYLVPEYDVEQGMVSVEGLKGMWGVDDGGKGGGESGWPEIVDLEELRFKRQIHEAISIVGISRGEGGEEEEREWVFKSLLRDQRYLYNELKMLITLGAHENVIRRPRYVVTKKGRFGGRKGVCGFILEYYTRGSLKQFLMAGVGGGGGVAMEQKFLWARQVTSALGHINKHFEVGFYPDLKPDNIVLRERASPPGTKATLMFDAVLLDMEQRGGWFSWSPPEVAYLEYLEILAASLSDPERGDGKDLAGLQEGISAQLEEYYSVSGKQGWTPGSNRQNERYYDSDGGFSAPWLALLSRRKAAMGVGTGLSGDGDGTPSERAMDLEKAQVFMLGKLLWCIFEEEGLLRCGIDHELLQNPVEVGRKDEGVMKVKGFPDFDKTPVEIRELIKRCTAGAGEWGDGGGGGWRVILNKEGKLVPADHNGGLTAEDTQRVATMFWKREVERAREFVTDVIERRKELNAENAGQSCQDNGQNRAGHDVVPGSKRKGRGMSLLEQARSRPTLVEVLDELERILGSITFMIVAGRELELLV